MCGLDVFVVKLLEPHEIRPVGDDTNEKVNPPTVYRTDVFVRLWEQACEAIFRHEGRRADGLTSLSYSRHASKRRDSNKQITARAQESHVRFLSLLLW